MPELLKRGATVDSDRKVRETAAGILAKEAMRNNVHVFCALEGLADHGEQANIRVRRYGGNRGRA